MYLSTSGYLPDFNLLKSYLFEISVTLSSLNTCFTNSILEDIQSHPQEAQC